MTIKSLTLSLILCSTVSACSVMNEQQCQTANWSALGYLDGSQGASANQFNDRSSACSKYNVRANFNEYQTSYKQGLATYCTESHGFYVGSNGSNYLGVCPQATSTAFLRGYRQGQQLFTLKNKVTQAEQALQNAQYDIEHQQQRLNKLKNSLIYDKLTARERQQKLEKIEAINQQPNLIKKKKEQLNRLKKQLATLESTLNY
ncbi:DUF2799 domain-containing protein [Photobacterium toruni]|uniref:DUF2799 domain-containing protein n=1 Tax=Photobacterium toruni TaxID=1935446 RepID=A0A1T4U6G6_9GAMM|nr:DUF2799 domain-containing protein [Photobacterium toruni]MEC6816125.1 DUF2799 domain-containing protein [Photobacterium toruni]MEC6830758.1 DUF2799 domain-containing protein [Photobacterium toruni]SKA48273.1 hypothetical protein CZ814_02766 [Photobacterium toruni]